MTPRAQTSEAGEYMGTILPLAIAATAGDLMCLVGAQVNGDSYPIGETLIVDGLFTIVGAIFGSPFGTVVYFGHPVHKQIGGKYAYSFINGLVYLIITSTSAKRTQGLLPSLLSLSSRSTRAPLIACCC